MEKINCVAVDLGASSGRLIVAEYCNGKINLREMHRFPNEPVAVNGIMYWDTFRLYHEIMEGLKKVSAEGIEIEGIAFDTWGVDYALLDKEDNILGVPIHYRDTRTEGIMEEIDSLMPLKEIYGVTGIQFMDFNTVFQLYADRKMRPVISENADCFLMMPDLFNFFLTGVKCNEYTNLSTTQLLNAKTYELDDKILDTIGAKKEIFQKQLKPGTVIGKMLERVEEETGLKDVSVIAAGSHDTASAVCGTPFGEESKAFLSCGTWSLIGIELDSPVISEEGFSCNFTNEGGVEDTIRFLKNINGLWILQQLRKSYNYKNKTDLSFPDIIENARNAKKKDFTINPDDKAFMAPIDMDNAIIEYCKRTGQGEPRGIGETAMAVYNGLTDEYKRNIEDIEKLTGKKIKTLHMIGGGIQDQLLCEMTAEKTGREVLAGPTEASVLGNVVMQLKALGYIASVSEGRKIIENSIEVKRYGGGGVI